jgi:hypothetical protein
MRLTEARRFSVVRTKEDVMVAIARTSRPEAQCVRGRTTWSSVEEESTRKRALRVIRARAGYMRRKLLDADAWDGRVSAS